MGKRTGRIRENTGRAEHWATLSPEFGACGGQNQSPIDLTGFIAAELPPIAFNYQAAGHEVLNNGHTVQVNYKTGSSIVVDGIQFELIQYHFHAPSENHIDGQSFPMEVHLVHASGGGNLAVVSVMFREGAENTALDPAWSQMPRHAGDKHPLSTSASAEALLPKDRDTYRFNGSLTTPPCSEGVRWLVMKEAVTASTEQIKAFADVLHELNNRPIQPTNARPVLK
jgi:carbonic anhydrase